MAEQSSYEADQVKGIKAPKSYTQFFLPKLNRLLSMQRFEDWLKATILLIEITESIFFKMVCGFKKITKSKYQIMETT